TPIIVDNFSNSNPAVLKRIEEIVESSVVFYELDVRDQEALAKIVNRHEIEATIHFAGYKAVGESVEEPVKYYMNNVGSTLALVDVLGEAGAKKFIFSSSATVYGDPEKLPITEDQALSATNPYGQTKLMCEQILRDVAASDEDWNISLLRYFNPVGAHESGLIGEDPSGVPNNLVPYIAQVAVGKRKELSVYGDDYKTPDGTGVRDYLHVVDLAKAHVAALEKNNEPGATAFNLGTGEGISVLEMIAAFETASGKNIPYKVVGRRAGDIASCYADPSKAEKILGWKAELGIERMCEDTWRWQSGNPDGFDASR
ncbi:MAG: UDP-glucose 4-epimerase GalE, partial [Candidatus Saccharibacteria bacterium]